MWKTLDVRDSQEKGTIETIIYITVFLTGIIGLFGSDAKMISFYISVISIVTGLIRCQNNILIKILFWLFLISTVAVTIYVIVLFFSCVKGFSDCVTAY